MQRKTAYNHLRRLERQVESVFCFARISGLSHQTVLDEIQGRVWLDPAYKRCPGWVRERLSERIGIYFGLVYRAVLHGNDADALWAGDGRPHPEYVRWQLRVDGEHIDTDEIIRRRKAGDEDIWARVEGAHIWNHRPDRLYGDGWERLNK